MISVSQASVSFGTQPLFSDATFKVTSGQRVALVGGNGAGKSTLLQLVLGLREPDVGTVSRPRDLRIGWLPQDVVDAVGESATVLEHVLEGASHVQELEARLRRLEKELETAPESDHQRLLTSYASTQDAFEQFGGYELESEAHRVLAGLGFEPGDGARPTSELSGGWRVRVALARLLLAKPDLLVLDEPTNHLDIGTIAWLESTLQQLPGSLLFVSHDRDFIDAVAEVIVEVAAGTTTSYDVRHGTVVAELGGFAAFIEQRETRLAQLRAARAQQDRVIAQQERFIERFRYKASKAKQVQSRIKKLEKVDRIDVPDHKALVARFGFPEPARAGRVVAQVEGLTVRYGELTVLDEVDLAIERGRKVALIGPNGAGKTTLLRSMAGEVPPTAGSVELGANVEVGMVDQHQAEVMDLTRTVLEEFQSVLTDKHRTQNHRTMLGAFGFPGDLAERRVSELSGGERTRLGLAKVMASPVNLLLLDEPTNHLDLASRDVLEDALQAYPGTVVLITHDRHVIRSVADAIVEVGHGKATWYDGTYEELQERRTDVPGTAVGAAPSVGQRAGRGSREPSRNSGATDGGGKRSDAEVRNARYQATKDLRREVADLEAQLGKTEQEVAELTKELADPDVYADGDRVKGLVARHGAAKDRATELLDAWESAQSRLDEAEARLEVG